MITIRKAADRGHADHGWLNSYHSFSFADYHDRDHMGFGPLRVINEDRVQPGMGFGTHAHRDMEIISYVLEGALAHKDSMGNGSVIRPGDVQRMSAGTGVTHSEFNHSNSDLVHFLQIWIEPNELRVKPSYEEKHFDIESKRGRLRLIASATGEEESVCIHQDARVYASVLDGTDTASMSVANGRKIYVHVARGNVKVNGTALDIGDAAKLTGIDSIQLTNANKAEILLFDLP